MLCSQLAYGEPSPWRDEGYSILWYLYRMPSGRRSFGRNSAMIEDLATRIFQMYVMGMIAGPFFHFPTTAQQNWTVWSMAVRSSSLSVMPMIYQHSASTCSHLLGYHSQYRASKTSMLKVQHAIILLFCARYQPTYLCFLGAVLCWQSWTFVLVQSAYCCMFYSHSMSINPLIPLQHQSLPLASGLDHLLHC